ncbi:MAG: phage major capsid protein [Coriobacteriales bacterium]|jgi:HK97 family phage major capsid protein|nr:phage major capsid protein [Coriobacteriales bacterium]
MNEHQQITERLAAIEAELRDGGGDVDALSAEVDALTERRGRLEAEAEARRGLRDRIATGAEPTVPVARFSGVQVSEPAPDPAGAEYRRAFFKDLASRSGLDIRGGTEMTDAERRAFTFLTSNTGALVPLQTQNAIKELVLSTRTLLDDVTVDHFTSQYEVPRHKATTAGDAAVKSEGEANADSQDSFDTVPIHGKDILKHAVISANMGIQSIDAFEGWLVNHIIARILHAENALLYAQLEAATYGIASGNKIEAEELTDDVVRRALSLIRGDGLTAMYASQATVYNEVAGVQDGIGRPLYLDNTMTESPLVAGRAYTAAVKVDDAVPDGVIWVGKPAEIGANEFEAPNILQDIDVTNRKRIFGGFAKFDALPMRSDCFVKIVIGPALG